MFRALRDSPVRLWLKHGSQDAQLPSPLYFGILTRDAKATKGVPSRSYGVRGRVPRRWALASLLFNHFCCPCCRGRLDCQALQDMMGTR